MSSIQRQIASHNGVTTFFILTTFSYLINIATHYTSISCFFQPLKYVLYSVKFILIKQCYLIYANYFLEYIFDHLLLLIWLVNRVQYISQTSSFAKTKQI